MNETIYSYGYELCRVLCKGRKGCLKSGGCYLLLRQPADKFHGSRRYGKPCSIIKAVKDAGYGAKEKGNEAEKKSNEAEDALEDHETPKLKRDWQASVIFY